MGRRRNRPKPRHPRPWSRSRWRRRRSPVPELIGGEPSASTCLVKRDGTLWTKVVVCRSPRRWRTWAAGTCNIIRWNMHLYLLFQHSNLTQFSSHASLPSGIVWFPLVVAQRQDTRFIVINVVVHREFVSTRSDASFDWKVWEADY
jgi:hypothetical protein